MLDEKIKELAYQRVLQEEIKISYQLTLEQFKNSQIVMAYENSKKIVEELESDIRQEAVKIFEETGNKLPHEAVEIKEKINLIVDEIKALEYAKEQAPFCLKIDHKVFDKFVKDLPSDLMPPGIEIKKVPSAYIDTDLSNYKKEE